jgi:hypothetical protein
MSFRVRGKPILADGRDRNTESRGHFLVCHSGTQVIQCVAKIHCMQ